MLSEEVRVDRIARIHTGAVQEAAATLMLASIVGEPWSVW